MDEHNRRYGCSVEGTVPVWRKKEVHVVSSRQYRQHSTLPDETVELRTSIEGRVYTGRDTSGQVVVTEKNRLDAIQFTQMSGELSGSQDRSPGFIYVERPGVDSHFHSQDVFVIPRLQQRQVMEMGVCRTDLSPSILIFRIQVMVEVRRGHPGVPIVLCGIASSRFTTDVNTLY